MRKTHAVPERKITPIIRCTITFQKSPDGFRRDIGADYLALAIDERSLTGLIGRMGSAALPFLRSRRPNNVIAADLPNIVIATLGSYGDTHPFIGIARELRDRGHNLTLIAPAVYQPLADLVGLNFAPIGSKEQF